MPPRYSLLEGTMVASFKVVTFTTSRAPKKGPSFAQFEQVCENMLSGGFERLFVIPGH